MTFEKIIAKIKQKLVASYDDESADEWYVIDFKDYDGKNATLNIHEQTWGVIMRYCYKIDEDCQYIAEEMIEYPKNTPEPEIVKKIYDQLRVFQKDMLIAMKLLDKTTIPDEWRDADDFANVRLSNNKKKLIFSDVQIH